MMNTKFEKLDLFFSTFPKHKEVTIFSFILIMAIFSGLLIVSVLPVKNKMEARNLRSAQEIVESGNWLVPTLNGVPRIRKPPLPTWATALMGKIFGNTRKVFYLRLPNMILGVFFIFFLFLLTKEIYNLRVALFSTAILATSVQLLGEMRTARWDMFACSLGIGALWATCKACKGNMRYFLIASLFWGLSFLSKGPMAFYTTLAPFFLAFSTLFWLEKKLGNKMEPQVLSNISRLSWNRLLLFAAIIFIGLLIGLSWWGFIWFKKPDTWQILHHDMRQLNSVHKASVFFYIALFLPLIAPWSLTFIVAAIEKIKFLRKRLFFSETAESSDDWSISSSGTFAFLWFFFALLLLSLVPAKKSRYFLGVLPAVAVFLGVFFDDAMKLTTFSQILLKIHKTALIIVCFCMPIAVYLSRWLGVPDIIFLLSLLFLPIGFFLAKSQMKIFRLVWETWFVSSLSYCMVFLCLFFIKANVQNPSYILQKILENKYRGAERVKELTKASSLFIYGKIDHRLTWEIGKNYQPIQEDKILQINSKKSSIMILVKKDHQKQFCDLLLKEEIPFQKIHSFGGIKKTKEWHLYSLQNLTMNAND